MMNKVTKDEFRLMLELLIATNLEDAYFRAQMIPSEKENTTLGNALLTFLYYTHDHENEVKEGTRSVYCLHPDNDLLNIDDVLYPYKLKPILEKWVEGYD